MNEQENQPVSTGPTDNQQLPAAASTDSVDVSAVSGPDSAPEIAPDASAPPVEEPPTVETVLEGTDAEVSAAPHAASEPPAQAPQPASPPPKAKGKAKPEKASKLEKAPKTKADKHKDKGDKAKAEKQKAEKAPKPKMMRDSFTMPEPDYALIAGLKLRCATQGAEVKKSELLRLGLQALARMGDEDLATVVKALDKLKTGRPRKA